MRPVSFITTNEGKFREVQTGMARRGIEVVQVDAEYPEVQADTLAKVARFGADVMSLEMTDFILEDSGFFMKAYGQFPGVYSKHVLRCIGLAGILRLAEGTDRKAHFETCLLYHDGEPHVFTGVAGGRIADRPRGHGGFGYDPIFIPDGHDLTFAEMSTEEKNAVSHRGRAVEAFADWLAGRE
ncbi:MAG: XTP/dITP diphosphatase [Thermoplasmata archaeon]|nr:XTP/dITP diphosphatase [Thermoplasmata archaeon]